MLYDLGIDISIKNYNGETAYDIAKGQGYNITAKFLQMLATNNENKPQSNG